MSSETITTISTKMPNGVKLSKTILGVDETYVSYGLFSTRDVKIGEEVYEYSSYEWPLKNNNYFDNIYLSIDNITSIKNIRITRACHAKLNSNGKLLYTGFDHFINHSCNPNTQYNEINKKIIAIRNIYIGDELTTNYNCINWDETTNFIPFKCRCKSKKCKGYIKGFKFLNYNEQQILIKRNAVSKFCIEIRNSFIHKRNIKFAYIKL